MRHINKRMRHSRRNIYIARKLLLLMFIVSAQFFISEAQAIKYLYTERPKLGLEYSYSYDKDLRESRFTDSEKVSKLYTERIDIGTAGWYYHPALLVYTLQFSPEWKQTSENDMSHGDKKTESNTYLTEYNTEFTILQNKPYTLILLGNRNTSSQRNTLSDLSEISTDIYQATLNLKYPILPTNLNYRHMEGIQTGFSRSQKESDDITLSLQHNKYMGTSSLDFSYSTKSEQSGTSSTEANSFDTTFQNTYSLGKNNSTLNSSAKYSEKDSSTQRTRRYGINEYVSWLHRKNFTTNYTLRYDKSNIYDKLNLTPSRSEAKSIGFNLRHFLYENLTTTVNVKAAENNAKNGRVDSYASQVNFNYNRKIPIGNLNIAAGYDYSIIDNKPRNDTISATETIRLTASPYLLEGSTINITSVHIREDPDSPVEKTPGTDYRLDQDSAGILITCLPAGTINCAAGQTVYVYYDYKSTTADLSNFMQNYSVQVNLWDIWTVYYNISVSDQKLLAGNPSEDLTDSSSYAAGSVVDWNWNRFSIEWEDHFVDSMPIEKWSIRDAVTLQPTEDTFFKISGSYGSTLIKDTLRNDKFWEFRSNLQKMITDSSMLDVDLSVDKRKGKTEAVLRKVFSAKLIWSYRIWSLALAYQFSNIDDSMNKQQFINDYFSFNIKRAMF